MLGGVSKPGTYVLISTDGKVYLSGLSSNLSMISHGQQQRVVHDFTKYSIKDMPAPQMLLEKLNGIVPCLLDTSTIPAQELTMSISRSVASSGLSDSLTTSTPRTSNGNSLSHPYHRIFSPHFHHFVEQCLQHNPDGRPSACTLLNHSFFKLIKRRASEALPELLCPVTPITNFEGSQSQDHSGIFGLVTNLEELEVDKWEF
ncbi:hypothetical protein EI555_008602 [Monodon monoceros]|uniref:Protein kinase domain-containing protein n=1 Tax=Monodon monoceros TaxID=40151 RepID=A0A4U1FF82_MONMO|nr:hypothetical protein EI555_008602 [Monodon monoceros]